MTETQLNILREWFREEMEYLIKRHITLEKPRPGYYDDDLPDDYYADKAFGDMVIAFCKEEE